MAPGLRSTSIRGRSAAPRARIVTPSVAALPCESAAANAAVFSSAVLVVMYARLIMASEPEPPVEISWHYVVFRTGVTSFVMAMRVVRAVQAYTAYTAAVADGLDAAVADAYVYAWLAFVLSALPWMLLQVYANVSIIRRGWRATPPWYRWTVRFGHLTFAVALIVAGTRGSGLHRPRVSRAFKPGHDKV